jgi:hypothetical protein
MIRKKAGSTGIVGSVIVSSVGRVLASSGLVAAALVVATEKGDVGGPKEAAPVVEAAVTQLSGRGGMIERECCYGVLDYPCLVYKSCLL